MTTDQEAQLCADTARIADALEALVKSIADIAATLKQGAAQAAMPPPSPPQQAVAPPMRVSA